MRERPVGVVIREAPQVDEPAWLRALVASTHDAIFALDLTGVVAAWSPGAEKIVGYSAEDIVGLSVTAFLTEERAAAVAEVFARLGEGDRLDGIEATLRHKEGRHVEVSVALVPIVDEAGRVQAISGVARDITESNAAALRSRRTRQDIETQERILEKIARGDDLGDVLAEVCRETEERYPTARCAVMMVDPDQRVLLDAAAPSLPVELRAAMDRMPVAAGMGACGTAAARGADVVVTDILTDPHMAAFTDLARKHQLCSVWSHPLMDQTGQILGTFAVWSDEAHEPSEFERRLIAGAGRLAALAIQRRHFEEALSKAALVDPLTGLPNRTQFLEVLTRGLEHNPTSLAVMFLDLDQFKSVNDTLGHPAGDRLLREAARRLVSVLREDDVLSRFGGDEFTVLVRDADTRGLDAVARRLLSSFAKSFTIDDREFFISASIGVAPGTADAGPFDLIRDADVAMYQAKARGPGHCTIFDENLRTRALARVTLDGELRRALQRNELVVHYQPLFELATGRCTGAEALVRWQHPTRGLLPPGEFVPLAEETGLVRGIGAIVLDESLAQLRRWAALGINVPVAVNVSPIELSNPSLVDEIEAALALHGVPPQQLLLEITETAVMEQIDTARVALERVTALGVGVFIDDFGTGYSSISRLSDLPVMGLKVDRRFTTALGTDPSITKLTMAIVDLARALDLEVIAEGIETEDALQELIALGCTHGQGYHLGKPGSPDAIAALF